MSVSEILADSRQGNGFRLPGKVYDALHDWFHKLRSEGVAVSRRLLRAQVISELQKNCSKILKSEGGWLTCGERMMKSLEAELNVSRRKATTAKRGSVESKENMREIFIARVSYVCNTHDIPRSLVFHMDETSVSLLPTEKRTLHSRGAKAVPIQHSDDKRQITCVVAGDLEGRLLPGQVIFEHGAAKRLPKVPGLFCTTSPKHWSTFETCCEWLDDILVPAAMERKRALKLAADRPACLIWDVFSAHRSEAIRSYIGERYPWLKLVFVPANCTDFLQPADVSLNAPFKSRMCELSNSWLAQQLEEGKKPDLRVGTLRPLVAQWISTALEGVGATDAAINGIRRVGLHTVWRIDVVNRAKALHAAGHLWQSASRNDIVAPAGDAPAAASLPATTPAAVALSDESEPETLMPTAGRKRRRPYHCQLCRKRGHTKPTCPLRNKRKAAASKQA